MSALFIYDALYQQYGAQHWWPADTAFEVMAGAILTQNTAWTNVEQALGQINKHHALDPHILLSTADHVLAEWLRPSGYFNIKCRRLKNYCDWYVSNGGYEALDTLNTQYLRQSLLQVNGVGHETADDILLYAFGRAVFVIDTYTRRIFSRLGLIDSSNNYETLRAWFEGDLEKDLCRRRNTKTVSNKIRASLYNEYHALIVVHAKDICKSKPLCPQCCLVNQCTYYKQIN